MKNLLFIICFIYSFLAVSQDFSDPAEEGEVIVEKTTDLSLSYKERRKRYGIIFSVNYEKFAPNNYVSINLDSTYENFSDESPMGLVGGEFGVKLNNMLGSAYATLAYLKGNFANDSKNLYNVSAEITKANIGFAFDNLMSEPWVVPYGQMGIHQVKWLEESYDVTDAIISQATTSEWAINYRAGLLFQLNWIENSIDPWTHVSGLQSSGLENTFIDLYYQHYGTTDKLSENEIGSVATDFESSQWGAGLKLEF